MQRMTIPLLVRHGADRTAVAVRAVPGTRWAQLRNLLLMAVGLPTDTSLYVGAGEVDGAAIVGEVPLLAGTEFTTAPAPQLLWQPPLVLAVIAGPDAGQWREVSQESFTVGRGNRCDWIIDDRHLSLKHALLTPTATGVQVQDLGSTNGIFINGKPLLATQTATVTTGDTVRIGATVLRVQLTAAPAVSATADGTGCIALSPVRSRSGTAEPLPPAPPRRPSSAPRRPIPWISVVLAATVGVGMALFFDNLAFLAFAALGPLTMVGTALADKLRGRQSWRKANRIYEADQQKYRAELALATADQRSRLWDEWPDPVAVRFNSQGRRGSLWQRRAGPITAVIGMGTTTWGTHPHSAVLIDTPLILQLPARLGLVGEQGRAQLRWIVAQLAYHYSPHDLVLITVSDAADFVAARLLPHASAVQAAGPQQQIVAILDGEQAITSQAGQSLLAAATPQPLHIPRSGSNTASKSPVLTVSWAESADQLPPACVLLSPELASSKAAATGEATLTGITSEYADAIFRNLIPLRCADSGSGNGIPTTLLLSELIEGWHTDLPGHLARSWDTPRPLATIGMTPSGPLTLDFDRDGPHMLIAGTTGSGKSELLLTLITSLAIANPPSSLTFLLIDYKGGAAFRQVADLPHVVGMVTDLDPQLAARALASLRAELRRREKLALTAAPPPPRLMVVVDEFATLAVELPDFLTGLLDIAQRGRSLGVHLVLATQRPAGVVTPAMRANIAIRVCLRVTDPADSHDVLGSAAAADISADTPGRAWITTSSGTHLVQTALVTAPPAAPVSVIRLTDGAIFAPKVTTGHAANLPEPAPIAAHIKQAMAPLTAAMPRPHQPWHPPLPQVFVAPPDSTVLALADYPEQQQQEALPLPETSLLVAGPAASGRSTALRRIGYVAALTGSEIVVLDGARDLADMAQWPAVSSYINTSDPYLIQRVLVRLLAAASGNNNDVSLPDSSPTLTTPAAASARPPRYLVIDHYDVIAAALDTFDLQAGTNLLQQLVALGPDRVRLIIAGSPNLLHQRLAHQFPTAITLDGPQLPGRGEYAGDVVHIAQCAVGTCPPAGQGSAWEAAGPSAPRIMVRALPTHVRRADLPDPCADVVPVGVAGDEARPLLLPLATWQGGFVVAGSPGSGISTALDTIATGAAAHYPVVVVGRAADSLAATAQPLPAHPGVLSPGLFGADLAAGTEQLRQVLAAHHGRIILVADHGGVGAAHPAAELLQRFCQVARAGQVLLIGERSETLQRAHRGHLQLARQSGRGLILGPRRGDGAIFDTKLPPLATDIPPGRGWWVADRAIQAVQVAQ